MANRSILGPSECFDQKAKKNVLISFVFCFSFNFFIARFHQPFHCLIKKTLKDQMFGKVCQSNRNLFTSCSSNYSTQNQLMNNWPSGDRTKFSSRTSSYWESLSNHLSLFFFLRGVVLWRTEGGCNKTFVFQLLPSISHLFFFFPEVFLSLLLKFVQTK